MATKTETKKGTNTKAKRTRKVRVVATERPDTGTPAPVDPFVTAPASGTKKAPPAGDNINNAPSNDDELGNVAADIADFAKAKVEWKAAEARFKALSGTVMSYAKRVMLDLFVKNGSRPKSQKLVGDGGAIVTTFYQDKPLYMDGTNTGRYDSLCELFDKAVVDADIAEFTGWSIPDKKMADKALVDKMRKALQAALTPEELDGLFVAKHRAQKGVVDRAAKLCNNDADKIDHLLQLTVPMPTLR